jgi:hypothetical protein
MRAPGMVVALFLAGLAGCSGAIPSGPAPIQAGGGAAHAASASIVIHIPKRVAASRKGRGPRYVSPSTQSATISLAPAAGCTGCSAAVSGDLSLTPSSQNCTTNGSGTTCTHAFMLNPGTYTGAISTYDGPLGCQNSNACHALSVNQSFPWTVIKGKANELAVTLYGVPANVLVVPSTVNAYAMGRIVFVGGVNQTARFTLYAADADGSLIVGPGAPSFAFSTKPANGWSASILGNVMQLQTGAAFATTKFNSFTLEMQGPACAVAGATCSYLLAPYVRPQLAITNPSANAVYVLYTTRTTGALPAYAVVTNGVSQPTDAKFDGTGRLFVANQGAGNVTVYDPPYTSAPSATIALSTSAVRFAVSSNGDVAVSGSFFGNASFTVFAAPFYETSTTVAVTSPYQVTAMNFAFNGSLWVATNQGFVGQYAPGSMTPVPNLALSRPVGLDTDKAGNLYVADGTQDTLTKYSPPSYASAASATTMDHPDSVINLNGAPAVCGVGGAQLFSSTLALGAFTPISGTDPCFVTADDLPAEYWVEAPFEGTQTQVDGPGTSALLPYLANSIAAFPRPDANY